MGNEGQQEEDVKAVTQNSAKGEEEAPRSSDRTSPHLRSWGPEEGAHTAVTEDGVEGVVSEEDPCAVATEGAAKVITVPWLSHTVKLKKEQAMRLEKARETAIAVRLEKARVDEWVKARLARQARELAAAVEAAAKNQARKLADKRRRHKRRHRGSGYRAAQTHRVSLTELRKAARAARKLWQEFREKRSKNIQELKEARQVVRSTSTYCDTQKELIQKIKALLRIAKERRQKKFYIRRHRELPDTRVDITKLSSVFAENPN